MPEKKTVERARKMKRQGKAPTTQAGAFVHEEIEHIREGKHGAKNAKQAIAIGLSKARRAGVKLGAAPKKAKAKTKRKATAARKPAKRTTKARAQAKRPSAKRSRKASRALERAPRAAASSRALSRQSRQAAHRRKRTTGTRAARAAAR